MATSPYDQHSGTNYNSYQISPVLNNTRMSIGNADHVRSCRALTFIGVCHIDVLVLAL